MDFQVVDGFLPASELARLREFLRSYRWFSVSAAGKRGPDGALQELLQLPELKLLGGTFVVMRSSPELTTDKIPYPSGTPLDGVLEAVAPRVPGWKLLGCGPRCYPPGRGMDWHDDAKFRSTFVLYAHDEWLPEWDGRLVFQSGETVEPRPNRCVLIKAGVPHTVRPGARPRLSVIGYDFEPKR